MDTVTGALVGGFKPTVDRRVSSMATSPDGSTVYLGGRFTTVNSQTVLNLAAVKASDGSLLPQRFADVQAPDPATTTSDILDLDVTTDGTSVIVGIGGKHFNVVGAWDAGSGARHWWHGFDPTDHLDGDVQAVRYDAGTVYFGFHGGYNGNNNRRLMAADATTGTLDPDFQPNINGIVGVARPHHRRRRAVRGGRFHCRERHHPWRSRVLPAADLGALDRAAASSHSSLVRRGQAGCCSLFASWPAMVP